MQGLTEPRDVLSSEALVGRRDFGAVTILDLPAIFIADHGARELDATIRLLVEQGRRRVLLNLSNVVYCDSAGFSEIAQAYAVVTRNEGTIRILNTCKRIGQFTLPMITGLLTIFEAFDDESQALQSFDSEDDSSK